MVFSLVTPVATRASQEELADTGQYRLPVMRQADFYEFWQAALTQLAQWPTQVTRDERSDELRFQGQGGLWCTAGYSAPAGCTVTAAILHIVERGNLKRHLSWNDGYAHLCINWYPPEPDREWNPEGLPDRQAYVLVKAIVDASRAVEVLLSQPEVLAEQVGIVGEGLGGAVALALAGLIPEKVSWVIAYEPWPVYHYPPSQRMEQSPQVAAALAAHEAQYPQWRAAMRRSAGYVDIINFAGQIEAPTLIVLPETTRYGRPRPAIMMYNQLYCEKQLLLIPTGGRQGPGAASVRKQICHDWAQRAMTHAQRPARGAALAVAELPVPEEMLLPPL